MYSCQQEALTHDNLLVVPEGQVAQELDDLVPSERQEVQQGEASDEAAKGIPVREKCSRLRSSLTSTASLGQPGLTVQANPMKL